MTEPDRPTYRVGAHEFTDPEYARMEEYAQGIGLGAYRPLNRPDTDIRCTHQDGAGQCLDHQGHLGDHQHPQAQRQADAWNWGGVDTAPPPSVSEG